MAASNDKQQQNLGVNTHGSSHAYSRSQPQMPQFMRYASTPNLGGTFYHNNPISHYGNQYSSHSPVTPNNFYQSLAKYPENAGNKNKKNLKLTKPKSKHIQQHSQPINQDANDKKTGNKSGGGHQRNSSLSMSYVQQQQQAFFTDNPPSTPSDSDDDIYEDMYRDGFGANNQMIQQQIQNNSNYSIQKPPKSKRKKKRPNKSRKETEDVWCCGICTYQNNMLLAYCELCGCKKPNQPQIVKREVLVTGNNNKSAVNDLSPSPPPAATSPRDNLGINVLDLNTNDNADNNNNNNNNNSQQPQFDNLLPLTPPTTEDNIDYHKQQIQYQQHQQIPDLLSIPPNQQQKVATSTSSSPLSPRSRRKLHRYTRSETNVLITKQNALKYWQCSVCTYAENPIEYPVCKMCSALPPERPPSPNPPFLAKTDKKQQQQIPKKSLYEQQQDALDVLSKSHLSQQPQQKQQQIASKEEETDPLGHQKSTSITQLPIMDESFSNKKQLNNNNTVNNAALIDFGFQEDAKDLNQQNTMISVSKSMVNQQQNQPQPPTNAVNPSLLHAQGGTDFANASKSGKNIIRGLPPYEIPDLPAEKAANGADQKKSTIANLGVDIQGNNNKAASGGIGGFFGKVYNGWSSRRRAQSSDSSNGLSPDNMARNRSRSKSPFGGKKGGKTEFHDISTANTSKRNISVATMPKKQQEKIAKRLGGLHTKKDLLRELDSSMNKLQKKLKQHANKVMTLKAEINVMEMEKNQELKQWNNWYVLELVDLAKEYYDHKLSHLNHQIELEKLHIECFTEKLQRLENASKNIKRNGKKWNVDDIRNNIEVAFHTAWRIRLSQDVPDKQDYVKQLSKIVENLKINYDVKKNTLGKEEISIEERKEQVFLFLQSTLAKYESRQMAANKSFKLSRNLDNEDDFYCPYDVTDQNLFDSFVLDQRTKEGRIVSRWLVFIRKKHKDITFEDLADFMQKLAHTFLHTYSLPSKQYYECVRILCYRCVFRQRIITRIIYDLLNTKPTSSPSPQPSSSNNNPDENPELIAMQQIANLDQIYQKKVMWMRALNEEQLGIKKDYWLKNEKTFTPSLSAPKSQNGRRSSQIALIAGKDIPFAESINLMGQLEIEYAVIKEYREQREKRRNNKKNNVNENKPIRRSVFSRSNKSEEEEEKKSNNNQNGNNKAADRNKIIPFVLPQEGLQTLLAATKCVYNTAMEYYYTHYPEKKGDKNDEGAFISQDDLFPIILYCVMQSKLETPHRLIHFIEHILPKEKTTMGQSAFALSALKAAVEYISQAKPTTFGMDAEIELD